MNGEAGCKIVRAALLPGLRRFAVIALMRKRILRFEGKTFGKHPFCSGCLPDSQIIP